MIFVGLVLAWAVVEAAMAIAGAARPRTRRHALLLGRIDWHN